MRVHRKEKDEKNVGTGKETIIRKITKQQYYIQVLQICGKIHENKYKNRALISFFFFFSLEFHSAPIRAFQLGNLTKSTEIHHKN